MTFARPSVRLLLLRCTAPRTPSHVPPGLVNAKPPLRASLAAALPGQKRQRSTAATNAEQPEIHAPLQTYNVTKVDARPVVSAHYSISFDDKKVLIPWEEGKTSHFQHFWLRDHCQCSECRHPETKQRLVDTFTIPRHIKPTAVEGTETGIQLRWGNGHESFFTWDWLHLHSYNPRLEKYLSPQLKLWGAEIKDKLPEIDYAEVMESDKGVARWTAKIVKYGFCYVNNTPISPEATKELVERIAFIRQTHYGGFYDFTADLSKSDTAYTNLALPVHTDTTYFTDPAGLQVFHLLSHDSGSGGETLLVDGFRAAKILLDEDADSYKILSKVRIPAHASGNVDTSIQPYAPFPVLNHHPVNGDLVQVRWNNDDRGTMDRWNDGYEVERFYEAMRKWNAILTRRDIEYRSQLKPGKTLVFDNWRVLHGRSAFTGERRVCGAYVNRDDFRSKFLMTNATREEVLRAL